MCFLRRLDARAPSAAHALNGLTPLLNVAVWKFVVLLLFFFSFVQAIAESCVGAVVAVIVRRNESQAPLSGFGFPLSSGFDTSFSVEDTAGDIINFYNQFFFGASPRWSYLLQFQDRNQARRQHTGSRRPATAPKSVSPTAGRCAQGQTAPGPDPDPDDCWWCVANEDLGRCVSVVRLARYLYLARRSSWSFKVGSTPPSCLWSF